jgi:acyl carrier protein
VFREQFGADKGARGGMLAALEAVPTGERRALLTTQVVDILVEILRLPQGDPVSLDLGFFDAGMDSLMSLEFRQRLGHEYDITLPPTVAFNYPTVGELIGYLSQDMLPLAFEDKAQESSGQTTSSPDLQQEDEAMQLAAVEDLSEDELAALLAEQLGQ